MLQKSFYQFKAFDPFDKMIRSFFYDNDYSVKNVNEEKVKHNFSTRHWQEIKEKEKTILCFDVHGISSDDISVTKVCEDGTYYIKVKGTTKNEILDCDMTVDARWAIPYKQFKKPTKKIENSLLYVFIEPEITKEEIETI